MVYLIDTQRKIPYTSLYEIGLFTRLSIMERVCHKSNSFEEAEAWDILQHVRMTPEERQKAAKELRKRIYGEKPMDVKQAHHRK